jgi:colanic acid biosynthesis protein WcaH
MTKQFLPAKVFKQVVDATPLVSIALVVRDAAGRVLLGKRNNRPAQGFWFVPGGRIVKNERLADAFKRLSKNELGLELYKEQANYLGLYEHFYEDSIFTDISTHYVVNAFEVIVGAADLDLPDEQHNDYRWFDEAELLQDETVHLHTKWYFMSGAGVK